MLVMDQFPIRRVILVLLIGANLLSNVGGLVIDTKTNGSKIVLELRQRYVNSLGHTTITPNVTGVQVFPDEAKNCRVKGVKQCYRPLVLQNGSPEECYYCQWVCSRYNLSSVDHYNWITTDYVNGSNTFKRYSYTKCVVEIELPDGRAGLASDKNYCDKANGNAVLRVNRHQYLYTWPDNQTVYSVNGTISFRFLLNFTNIHQAETGEKCVPLIVYGYCDVLLQLMCNQNETNMGLYILTSGRSAKLLVEDVLNDDSVPTLQNSFHVGHAIDTNNNLSALYVNGQHVHSLKSVPDVCIFYQFYNTHGLSGILFDFTVYRLALTQRLVNEVYLGRKVSVLPGDECYCPYTHPLSTSSFRELAMERRQVFCD
ncbi:hypothetical protein EB796_003413 [Bugula neritina]|uniref:Uncharacterized protein n=1 Tax=Bugula neritina TaxID=10212 RepID=A0A7J7KI91_BUGNE|nr:hypothetical protein EB796_003413 [Bugula neritina]